MVKEHLPPCAWVKTPAATMDELGLGPATEISQAQVSVNVVDDRVQEGG